MGRVRDHLSSQLVPHGNYVSAKWVPTGVQRRRKEFKGGGGGGGGGVSKGGSRNIERGGLERGSGGSAPGKIVEH